MSLQKTIVELSDMMRYIYLEGQGAYLQIVTAKSKIMTLLSFAQITELLPKNNFTRVHKSYIVALDKIENIERNVIKVGKEYIPVGKSYQEDFYKKI